MNAYSLEKKENRRLKKLNRQINKNTLYQDPEKRPIQPPKRSVLEEVGNAVTHGLGAILAVIGLLMLLSKSTNGFMIVAACIYMGALFYMMLNSCLYHSFKWGRPVKRLWRRFDYTSIYLLIGGTFAPLQLVEISREYTHGLAIGIVYISIMWALIITGVTLTAIFGPGRVKKVNFPLYFIIGWSGLALVPGFIKYNIDLFYYILAGGLVYSLGMIPFAAFKGKESAHFIWHIFVLAGAVVQFIGIYLYIYCA